MTALANTFQVAFSDDMLEAFSRLPQSQQKKVREFLRKFRENPTAPSIDYEAISTFADPKLRTVRIDQAYRAIVARPEHGNVFVMLWVAHHDDAHAWAKNKRVEVHPETGTLQVYAVDESAPPPAAQAPRRAPASAPPLFAALSDAELASLGVPGAVLPLVREVMRGDELPALRVRLPREVFEALTFLADGESLDEVKRALGIEPPVETVDTQDFASALARDETRRSFVLVDNDDELAAMLEAPLDKWRVFLHPSQRKLVERTFSGPVRVLGGAGTGKTVVAMHRAAHLAQKVFTGSDDRILFTTFTNNLAADIRENLGALVSGEAARRIEVVHLDRWVAEFLQRQGYRYKLTYWQPGEGEAWTHWARAIAEARDLGLPESFFREEWEYVVQAQGCLREEDYLSVARTGRGVRLSRGQRKRLWTVFAEYRNSLDAAGLRESLDAMRDAIVLLDRREGVPSYRAVIVDEAQDMSTTAFMLLRKIAGPQRTNDMFIVGDGHQRIYRRQVVLGQAGVNIVGRSQRLRINYRTTDEIRRRAVALLEGVAVEDLDGGIDSMKGYRSLAHGAEPETAWCASFDEEIERITRWVKERPEARTCLVARTGALVDRYERALERAGIHTTKVRRDLAEDQTSGGLRVATMHRVKGLEFDRVIIAAANEDVIPLKSLLEQTDDPAVREDVVRQERALLYVAMTRARHSVFVTGHGRPTAWLAS